MNKQFPHQEAKALVKISTDSCVAQRRGPHLDYGVQGRSFGGDNLSFENWVTHRWYQALVKKGCLARIGKAGLGARKLGELLWPFSPLYQHPVPEFPGQASVPRQLCLFLPKTPLSSCRPDPATKLPFENKGLLQILPSPWEWMACHTHRVAWVRSVCPAAITKARLEVMRLCMCVGSPW